MWVRLITRAVATSLNLRFRRAIRENGLGPIIRVIGIALQEMAREDECDLIPRSLASARPAGRIIDVTPTDKAI